jgi:hypothetical protein
LLTANTERTGDAAHAADSQKFRTEIWKKCLLNDPELEQGLYQANIHSSWYEQP